MFIELIYGFLEAGKTTFIRHLLEHPGAGERWVILVNEFGVALAGTGIRPGAESTVSIIGKRLNVAALDAQLQRCVMSET